VQGGTEEEEVSEAETTQNFEIFFFEKNVFSVFLPLHCVISKTVPNILTGVKIVPK
jgi:hypothetical protein